MELTRRRELAAIALEVAEEAAAFVMTGYRSGVHADEKARADLVTRFDLESERLIRARLTERTPELPVVGEEEGGLAAGPTWYCDPIDGTTNFVHGHPIFCVSIGLLDGQQPLVGAVVAPALHTHWAGVVGDGAQRNGERCQVSSRASLQEALIATGFHPRSQGTAPDDNVGTFAEVVLHARGIRRCGSAAIDTCMVADGTYDAYWERLLSVWDTAGGAAIALAAGARITALHGGPVDFHAGHLLVSNGLVHDPLVALIARAERAVGA